MKLFLFISIGALSVFASSSFACLTIPEFEADTTIIEKMYTENFQCGDGGTLAKARCEGNVYLFNNGEKFIINAGIEKRKKLEPRYYIILNEDAPGKISDKIYCTPQ